MKKLILILSFLFVKSIYAQDSTYTRLWDNGEKKIEGIYKNGEKEGEWNKWNEKGELTEQSIYLRGILSTKTVNEYYLHTKNLLFEKKIVNSNNILVEHRWYFPQNNETYKIECYYDNGILKSSGKMVQGEKEGKWIAYNLDGNILIEQQFSSSQIKGPYKIFNYFDNGNVESFGKMLNGKQEGKWTFYDEKGNVLSSNNFKEGINVNNPNYQIIKNQEKEKKEIEKENKEKMKAEQSIQKTYDNANFSKGYYINKKGTTIDCYFKEGLLQSAKLIYKIDLSQKEEVLPLNDVKNFKIKEETYTVIDAIELKACNLIGEPIYENKITTDIIKGRINLYATSVQCLIPVGDEGYSRHTTDVFIVKKGEGGIFQEMILKDNEYRKLIKKLVEDNEEIMKEINFEEIIYNDLVSIIDKYNSNKNTPKENNSQSINDQENDENEKISCNRTIWLDKKIFDLHKIVTAPKESCLIVTGLTKINIIKVYTSNPNKGGKELLAKGIEDKKNIKISLSSLEPGTYFMFYTESQLDSWTTLIIK